jgi:hypothetical protein
VNEFYNQWLEFLRNFPVQIIIIILLLLFLLGVLGSFLLGTTSRIHCNNIQLLHHHLLILILTWGFGSVFAWNHIENTLQQHLTLVGSHCAAIEPLVASSSMAS